MLTSDPERALRIVEGADILVFDVETSGVDWKVNFPVGYVIGCADEHHYIPVRHGGGGNIVGGGMPPDNPDGPYQIHEFEKALAVAFYKRADKRVVGHNLKFDWHFANNATIDLGRNMWCTQNLQALLDEYTQSFSLADVAGYHGVTAKKGTELYEHMASQFGGPADRNQMANFWRLPGNDPLATEYAVGDGVTTLELYHAQMKKVLAEDLLGVADLEADVLRATARMERRGMGVNVKSLDSLGCFIQGKLNAALSALPPDFNTRSPKQVLEYVRQFKTDWPTTDKGNPSFTQKWLESFPEGRNITSVRKWTHLRDSFLVPLRDKYVFSGRVHANLSQLKSDNHGAVSGRFACSNPNMQGVPKHNKEVAKPFRNVFEEPEDYVIVEGDFSQFEPCLFAHYSKSPRLLEGYRSTPRIDVHTIVAQMLNKDRATTAKRMNMGIFTGMQPRTFADHLGVSVEEATSLWNAWYDLFPEVRTFQNLAKRAIIKRGHVRTIMGRRGRLEAPRFAYRATSKIIQGSNADIIKKKVVEVDRYFEQTGEPGGLLMTIHDSLVWTARKDRMEEVNNQVRAIMTDVPELLVPLKVDIGYGKTWAEASFGA